MEATVALTPAFACAAPEALWISAADTALREIVVAATLSHPHLEDLDSPLLLAACTVEREDERAMRAHLERVRGT
jgi:hypothetical protein